MRITEKDLQSSVPDVTRTLHLPGLDQPVRVYRDRWGIPHIKAASENDLFLAQGFVTAQDRLWQMDVVRHQALGRCSQFFGSCTVPQDRLLRACGVGHAAKLDYEVAGADARAMVDAYTVGVNAFLGTSTSLPIEYTILKHQPWRWENWHCLAVYKMRNTLLGPFEAKLWRSRNAAVLGAAKTASLIKGYPHGQLLTVPPGAVFEGPEVDGLSEFTKAVGATTWLDPFDGGSNAWAIGGSRTQSGLPLVAGDSHRALDAPNVYYQVHLSCPTFTVIGYAIPGMPGALHFCHNECVAWAMTYGMADTQDLFIERFRESLSGREYEFEGAWRDAELRNETITVRGADPFRIEVTHTHHGPVIAGDPKAGTAITLSTPGLVEATPWLDAVRDAMRSRSVEELHEAFRNWTDRNNNYAVADIHGNFGYLFAGKIPIRGESNGWRAVPGWTGEHEWQGYIPHEELPKAINPAAGYAVTCNQRVVDSDYPYYMGLYFSSGFRARQIQRRILKLEPGMATVDDMAGIHGDRTSIPAQTFVRVLIGAPPMDNDSAQAMSLFRQWDGSMDRDEAAPLIYARTRAHALRAVVDALLGDQASRMLASTTGAEVHLRLIDLQMTMALEHGDLAWWPEGCNSSDLLATSLKDALADLREMLGNDMSKWKWGHLHRTRAQHPLSVMFPELAGQLDPPSLPVHGNGDTPLAGGHGLVNGLDATSVSVNRYILDPSDWNRSRWIVPLGSSGHPGSPHFADQAHAWSNVQYIAQLWDWDRIASEAESQQCLEPVGT